MLNISMPAKVNVMKNMNHKMIHSLATLARNSTHSEEDRYELVLGLWHLQTFQEDFHIDMKAHVAAREEIYEIVEIIRSGDYNVEEIACRISQVDKLGI
jgi:hypothetical protein